MARGRNAGRDSKLFVIFCTLKPSEQTGVGGVAGERRRTLAGLWMRRDERDICNCLRARLS